MTENDTETPAPAKKAAKKASGLNGMLVADLKAMANGLGIKGASTMKKPQLVEAIRAAGTPKGESRPDREPRAGHEPRADRELLNEHAKGLIATTGCPSGEVQTRLRLGQYSEARRAAGEFQDIFGRDSYFLELMDHGLSIETRVRDDLLTLSKELDTGKVSAEFKHGVLRLRIPKAEHAQPRRIDVDATHQGDAIDSRKVLGVLAGHAAGAQDQKTHM